MPCVSTYSTWDLVINWSPIIYFTVKKYKYKLEPGLLLAIYKLIVPRLFLSVMFVILSLRENWSLCEIVYRENRWHAQIKFECYSKLTWLAICIFELCWLGNKECSTCKMKTFLPCSFHCGLPQWKERRWRQGFYEGRHIVSEDQLPGISCVARMVFLWPVPCPPLCDKYSRYPPFSRDSLW